VIRVINDDGPGEGFNDPRAWAPRGGNPAITLGAARLAAFQFAAKLLGDRLQSGVVIEVSAQMNALDDCSPNAAILGQAGSSTVHENFLGGEHGYTWYPQALANALAGGDLAPDEPDIIAVFNSGVDSKSCLGGTDWYYGFDGNARRHIDFVSVVLHELTHGLGFVSLVDPMSGAKLMGDDDVFSRLLQNHGAHPARFIEMTDEERAEAAISEPNLQWIGSRTNELALTLLNVGIEGGHVLMSGPNPVRLGSSVSHFSQQLFPHQIMEPAYAGPHHNPDFLVAALQDMGWKVPTPLPLLGGHRTLALAVLLLGITLARGSR
jgi:hypothetical protein